jgi:hypothetical protein
MAEALLVLAGGEILAGEEVELRGAHRC